MSMVRIYTTYNEQEKRTTSYITNYNHQLLYASRMEALPGDGAYTLVSEPPTPGLFPTGTKVRLMAGNKRIGTVSVVTSLDLITEEEFEKASCKLAKAVRPERVQ